MPDPTDDSRPSPDRPPVATAGPSGSRSSDPGADTIDHRGSATAVPSSSIDVGGSRPAARTRASVEPVTPFTEIPDAPPLTIRPDLFPNYEVVREISRGGQAVVYQAVNVRTRRKVAIKVMHQGPFAGPKDLARFEREVSVLAQMSHPRIVAVHDSGVAGAEAGAASGSFYLVMDYVPGEPLDRHLERRAGGRGKVVDAKHAIRLVAKSAEAVHAAHLRGVIHRDLKPGNIRVDPDDEPHILDFGLAKTAGDDGPAEYALTQTGLFMGTPAYASPEQACGMHAAVDVRTDVYSLGVILFQALTGGYPYDVRGATHDVLVNVARQEPARPSRLRRGIDDELETIVLKCLQKERDRRYQSAGDLARDLNRYLVGDPIEAKRDSALYVLRKTLRRHRAVVALAGVIVAVAAGAMVFSLAQWRQTAIEKERAEAAATSLAVEKRAVEEARQAAEAALVTARQNAERATAAQQKADRVAGDLMTARDEDRAERARADARAQILLARAEATRGDHAAARSYLLAAVPPREVADAWARAAWLYFRTSRERDWKALLPTPDRITLDRLAARADVRVVPRLGRVMVRLTDGRWLRLGPEPGAPEEATEVPPEATQQVPPPVGGRYAVAVSDAPGPDGEQLVVLFTGGRALQERSAPARFAPRVRVSPDGNRVALLDLNTNAIVVKRLDVDPQGQPRLLDDQRIVVGPDAVLDVAFAPDGASVHAVCDDWTYHVWAVGPASDVRPVAAAAGPPPRRAAFAVGARRLVTAGLDGVVRVWNAIDDGRPLMLAVAADDHPGRAVPPAAAVTDDGRWLVTASPAGVVRSWDLQATGGAAVTVGAASLAAGNPLAVPLELARSMDARTAKSAAPSPAQAWATGQFGLATARLARPAGDWRFAPAGTGTVLLSADGRTVVAIDGLGFKVAPLATDGPGPASSVLFARPGDRPDGGGWDLSYARLLACPAPIAASPGRAGGAVGSPRAILLTTRSRTGAPTGDPARCDVWDADTGRHLAATSADFADVRDCDLSADGDVLALCTASGVAAVWEWRAGKPPVPLESYRGRAMGGASRTVRFQPAEGAVLATAADDGRVVFWDAVSRKQLAFAAPGDGAGDGTGRRAGTSDRFAELAFSPDRKSMVVATAGAIWWLDLAHYDEQIKRLREEQAVEQKRSAKPATSPAGADR